MSILARWTKAKPILAAVSLLALVVSGGCVHKKYENPITKDTQQPDKVLFDKAVKDIEHGRYEIARLTLNTLMNTYDTSEYLAKAKLAIADSWMREGGTHAWAQAEAEYHDFILFYPSMEESAEAQMKICDIHFKQLDKPDRDNTHLLKADEECKNVLSKFPNSRFAPQAAERVRQVQEVVGESEYRVGAFYRSKANYSASANRLQAITDQYPLYSGSDLALWALGDDYAKLGPRFRQKSIEAYQKLVREYPLSMYAEDAKKHLRAMEAEIPEPDPVAIARMRYEQENVTHPSLFNRYWGLISSRPDVSRAAKSGEPSMASFRPTIPPLVPIPGATTTASGGVTDVQASTNVGPSSALETRPDARQSKAAAESKDLPTTNVRPQQVGATEARAAGEKAEAEAKAKAQADAAASPQANAAAPAQANAKSAKSSKKPTRPKPVRRKIQKPSKPKKQKPVLPSESTSPAQPAAQQPGTQPQGQPQQSPPKQ
ncbi:MAG: outer membrane protein assembly factor BamD [Bryobacteraceae bacterium]